MPHRASNVKFMTAVVHWLSSFPSSTISHDESFVRLSRPRFLTQALRLIIDDSFEPERVFEMSEDEEFTLIFDKVKDTFRQDMKRVDKFQKHLQLLSMELLSLGDYFALEILCVVLLEIGLHSYRSSLLISTLSLLSEEDQLVLKPVMFDSQDFTMKNLILTQRIDLAEQEMCRLKSQMKQYHLDYAKLEREKQCVELECCRELKLKDEAVEELKLELNALKYTNRSMKASLAQWDEDFKRLALPPSPVKRQMLLHQGFVTTTSSSVTRTPENNFLRWQYNLLSEWKRTGL